jgi:hypothetical protein
MVLRLPGKMQFVSFYLSIYGNIGNIGFKVCPLILVNPAISQFSVENLLRSESGLTGQVGSNELPIGKVNSIAHRSR